MTSLAGTDARNQSGAMRCPVCGATGRHRRERESECDHCGLVVADARLHWPSRDEIRAALTGDAPAAGWRLDAGAARNAGWALGLVRHDAGWRPATPCPHRVTLAVMAREAEAEAVAALIAATGFARAIVLFDAERTAIRIAGAETVAHPLDQDFAAQRNRMQERAGTGWVLHLDSDERADAALLGAIGWLVRAAAGDGLRALGLPRRNLVDGMRSDLWPDIQYRLVRADVRFAGTVHERPAVPFAETSLALAGAIDHHLSRARVVERTRVYGAMATDGARPQDEAALLRPYREASAAS